MEDRQVTAPDRLEISRRTFVKRSGLLAGGVIASANGPAASAQETSGSEAAPLPVRTLGRTRQEVTTLTLGTAPCGLCPKILPTEIAGIVDEALELGVTSIDTAPAYKQSEEGIGLTLGDRRKDVFLATKVLADTLEEAERSLASSFRLLRTDWFDLVYYHSVGSHDVEKAMASGGVFDWLVKQKKAGKFRFLGISGHHLPMKFIPLIESGEVDVLLTVINFVDRHTYGFEDKVLPVARKHNLGIVAMKVFGGAKKSAGSYENPQAPPELDLQHLQKAVRYSLGIPGVTTANIGVHNREQLRRDVAMVRDHQPLTDAEQQELATLGKRLARQWGPHFGDVA
jgi:predicted aldo/keto reductase-like oxidoreductase